MMMGELLTADGRTRWQRVPAVADTWRAVSDVPGLTWAEAVPVYNAARVRHGALFHGRDGMPLSGLRHLGMAHYSQADAIGALWELVPSPWHEILNVAAWAVNVAGEVVSGLPAVVREVLEDGVVAVWYHPTGAEWCGLLLHPGREVRYLRTGIGAYLLPAGDVIARTTEIDGADTYIDGVRRLLAAITNGEVPNLFPPHVRHEIWAGGEAHLRFDPLGSDHWILVPAAVE